MSIIDGFVNNIPYYIISDPVNLRIIEAKENYKKNRKSCISKEELLEAYENKKYKKNRK